MVLFCNPAAAGETLEKYQTYISHRVSRRTANIYNRVLRRFFHHYYPNTDHLNRFLSEGRSTRSTKAAFRHLFQMLGHPEFYGLLIPIKDRPRQKPGFYTEKDKIMKIIKNIKDERHKIVAMMQYDSGRRSHEIIGISRANISKDSEGDMLFYTIAKGSKEDYFYVSKETEKRLAEFLIVNTKKYPFIRSKSKDLITAIDTNTRYYRNNIYKAAAEAGMQGFRTHDFRRNFIQDAYMRMRKLYFEQKVDVDPILAVQKLVGHSRSETTRGYLKEIKIDMKKAIRGLRG